MRCKSCDSILASSEIIWDEESKQHEELCRKCRQILSIQCPDSILVYDQDIRESYDEAVSNSCEYTDVNDYVTVKENADEH